MIILPEEDRKPSRILKWTFRLLMAFVVLFCTFLFMLNILSGTSEAHRRGLEQAMSDVFKSHVTIGQLKTFNLFPQFVIEMQDVRGQRPGEGAFRIEDIMLAFSFSDLLFKRNNIEDVRIKNLEFSPGVIGDHPLQISSLVIEPDSALKQPAFHILGRYGSMPLDVLFGIKRTATAPRASYEIEAVNPVILTSGPFVLTAVYKQTDKREPLLADAVLTLHEKKVAEGSILADEDNDKIKFKTSFLIGKSQGTVTTALGSPDQDWDFEMVALDDIMGANPVWAEISAAWRETTRKSPEALQVTQAPSALAVTIKTLEGSVSGTDLQGRFVSTHDGVTGWWTGTLSSLPATKQDQSASGQVTCALVDLVAQIDVLQTDVMVVVLGDKTLKASVSVNPYGGKVTAKIDKVSANKASLFGLKPDAFLAHKDTLHLVDAPACLDLLGQKVSP